MSEGLSRRLAAAVIVVMACGAMVSAAVPAPQAVAAAAARKVVKIHGAGGVRGLEAYQSGIIVSPAGRVVTALSTVLDAAQIDCVLDDGRRFPASLVGVDPRRELAVLSIEATDLPSFAVDTGERVSVGTRIFAASNLFGVAVGDERVSVQRGVISAVVPLAARRGAAAAAYTGEVYVLDRTTNNPGSPGGAVVDSEGRLVGMLGKELRATATGIWLNYALPVDELAAGIEVAVSGGGGEPSAAPSGSFDPRSLGIVLVPDLLDRTPPFVESVLDDSAAARAGLRADDLVIAIAGRTVASRAAVQQALAAIAPGDPVRLAVIRGGDVVECDCGARPADTGVSP
ncbi:MAG: S1C family serine protease [Pirellulales bacterium]